MSDPVNGARNAGTAGSPEGGARPVDPPSNTAVVSPDEKLARYEWALRANPPGTFGVPTAIPAGMATSEQVESFRELRTRLMLMASGLGLERFTTLVVPLTDDSGASFVARNLAAAFTLQQHHALLIDCNFRNATQHEVLGPDLDVEGLFDFLGSAGRSPVELPMLPTVIPGLHLIPAGHCEAMIAGAQREYLSSASMKQLMAKLRDLPCHVILDAPPVKGSPDARILSELADFVVLVVGYGRTSNHDIAQAAAVFDRNKFAGVVFNEYTGAQTSKRER